VPKQTVKDVDIKKTVTGTYSKEERTVKWINDMVRRAKVVQSQKHTRWDENLEMYKGEHWEDEWLPDYKAKAIDNKCFANIESAIPIITDNRPTCELEARVQSDVKEVEMLQKAYEQRWDELTTDLTVVETVREVMIDGEGYWKIFWNPSLKNGIGDVDIKIANKKCVHPDPDSVDPLLRDARYIAYESLEQVIDLKLWYPKSARRLQQMWDKKRFAGKDGKRTETTGKTPYGMNTRLAVDEGEAAGDGTPSTEVGYTGSYMTGAEKLPYKEVWIDDKTMITEYPNFIIIMDTGMEKIPEEDRANYKELMEYYDGMEDDLEDMGLTADEDFFKTNGKELPEYGYEKVENKYRKYPYGRWLACCEDVLLRDDPWPYEHGRSPYVRFFRYHIPTTGDFLGDIDQIKPMNKQLNKREAQVTDILSLTANPPMIVNVNSGIEVDSLTNEPGLVIPTYSDVRAAASWLQPPNIPSALFEDIAMTRQNIDDISGVHDVTRGKRPAGLTSGVAIETLQEAAQTRLRLAARNLEWSLQEATRLIISIMWQFYAEPRTIRNKTTDGIKFEQADFTRENRELVGGLPEVRIVRGSTMQTNKGLLKQQALEIFAAGGIDREALLDIFEFPGKEEIIARMGGGNPNVQMPQQPPSGM